MQLEQRMYQPKQIQRELPENQKVYTNVDLEYLSASVLYGSGPLKLGNSGPLRLGDSGPLTIRDFPDSKIQLHIHGLDLDHVTYGRIIDYERNVLREFNGYEASMADLFADSLKIEKILRQLKKDKL